MNTTHKAEKTTVLFLLESALVGILAGLTAVAYRFCLSFAENGLYTILDFIRGNTLYIAFWFLFLITAGYFTAHIVKWESMASGSGIPQVCGEITGQLKTSWWRVLLAKFTGGTLSILSGLSLGREGPSIQIGAMTAKGYSRFRSYEKERENTLLSCGAGAGLAAAFNAPLAGILFVLEEIYHTFHHQILAGGLVAVLCADYVSKLFFSQTTIFSFPAFTIDLHDYWLLIPFGILLGFAGAGYNFIMLQGQTLFKKLKKVLPCEFSFILTFIIAGILGLFVPEVLAGGHQMIVLLEKGQPALLTLFVLLIIKFLFSTISFGSGAPGGIFFPLLILGAYLGAIYGNVVINLFSVPEAWLTQFIILGMAGLFAGIVRAPITGIVLITEMTGNMHHFIDIALVSILAYIVANLLKSKPIYTSLLERLL